MLVGRDEPLAAIERAVAEVRGGGTRALVVVGEPGIGKTALLEAAVERAAAAGLLTLPGRAAEHEREIPFALAVAALDEHAGTLHPTRVEALGPVLGAVLPSIGPGVPASAERFRYHRALRALVELLARERPLALLLDDLHWADDASLEFIQHLLRRPPRAPHLLMLALRAGCTPSGLLHAAMPGDGLAHLTLGPLDREASLALLAGVDDRRRRESIANEAGGNPLFLTQLARVPEGEIPPCIVAAVALEVARLPGGARALLEGAAVAGDPFDPELAHVAAEQPADALDTLVAAGLVRPTGTGRAFAFRHPLVRRAVYDAAPPAWRLGAHERIATALARRGAGAGVRAHHVERFARLGDEDAIALLLEAATAARDTSPATAARWYAAALALVPDADPGRRLNLRAQRALALAAAGRVQDGRDELVEVLARLPDGPARTALVVACAAFEKLLGRPGDARRRLLGANAQDNAELALELAGLGACYDDGAGARLWADRARAATDEPALIVAADALAAGGLLMERDPLAALPRLDAARARLDALDDAAVAARLPAVANVALSELAAERFADATASAARGLALARATGQGQLTVSLSAVAALAAAEQLDLHAALTHLENAADGADLQEMAFSQAIVAWARIQIHDLRGEFGEALNAAETLATLGLEQSFVVRNANLLSATLHADRDPERCLHELVALAGPRLERVDATMVTRVALVAVRCAIALGRLDDAARWAAASAALMGMPGAARATTARGELLLARGQAERAAEVALAAAASAEHSGARRDAAVARLLAGRALAVVDGAAAKAQLRHVAEQARRGGAFALVGDAARELRRLGTRIPTAPGIAANGTLTGRERDVAERVAQGRSNKQVAADLFITEKTVEGTLTRVYAKLGVRSRMELARRM